MIGEAVFFAGVATAAMGVIPLISHGGLATRAGDSPINADDQAPPPTAERARLWSWVGLSTTACGILLTTAAAILTPEILALVG